MKEVDKTMIPTLYTTGCPKCKVLKKKLEDAKIEYIIEESIESIMEVCNTLGVTTVPILEVEENKYLDFTEAIKWVGEYSAN